VVLFQIWHALFWTFQGVVIKGWKKKAKIIDILGLISEMAYDAAEKLLHTKTVGKTAFQSFRVDTLAKLCHTYGLSVTGTGRRPKGSKKKSDYIDAIFSFVGRQ
jgi:hypothetical protein